MGWGLVLVIAAVVFLVAHLALDLRSLSRNLRLLSHNDAVTGQGCERCHTLLRGGREIRHEAMWMAAAVIVLTIHIVLDFIG